MDKSQKFFLVRSNDVEAGEKSVPEVQETQSQQVTPFWTYVNNKRKLMNLQIYTT